MIKGFIEDKQTVEDDIKIITGELQRIGEEQRPERIKNMIDEGVIPYAIDIVNQFGLDSRFQSEKRMESKGGPFEDIPVCADCIYWNRHADGLSWGGCKNDKVKEQIQNEGEINTQQNFGCRYQEEKELDK